MYRDTAPGEQDTDSLAMGLGWFSIALGVAELAAPHSVARFIGVPPTDQALATLRAYGAREVGNGLAILVEPDRAAWVWSRVAGDAVDLATLAGALNAPGTDRSRALMATIAMLGVTAVDVLCARQLQREDDELYYSDRLAARGRLQSRRDSRTRVSEAITINASLARVEQRWADLRLLPESLRQLRQSSDGGDERAIVEFRHAPGGRGTEVRVEMEYTPRGVVGTVLATVLGGDPTGQVRQDLRRFKQLVETGEVLLSEGPSLTRPGQPAENVEEIHKAAGLEVSR
jgi:uncharacterized membrane protein